MLSALRLFVLATQISLAAALLSIYICKQSSGNVKSSSWTGAKTTTAKTKVEAPNGETLQVNVDCKKAEEDFWKIRSCSPATTPGLKIPQGEAYTISVKDSYYAMMCNQKQSPTIQDTFMDVCKTQLDEAWSRRAKNGYKPSKDDKKKTMELEHSAAVPGTDGAKVPLSLTVACLDTSPKIRSCTFKGGNRFLDSVTIEAGSEANILYAEAEYRLNCKSVEYPQVSKKDGTSYIERVCQKHLETEQAKNRGASVKSLASTVRDSYTEAWQLNWSAGANDEICECKSVTERVQIAYSCFGAAPKIKRCRRGLTGLKSVNAGDWFEFRCSKVVSCSISCSPDETPSLSCRVNHASDVYGSPC